MSRNRQIQFVRICTSLNWVGGTLLMVAAVAGPLFYEYVYVSGFRQDVVTAVEAIAAGERDELVLRERFLAFGHTGAELPNYQGTGMANAVLFNDPRFQLDGIVSPQGHLLIRAMTRPAALDEYWLPAIVYQQELDVNGDTVREEWVNGS